jgi:tetratricopeptide (TPR) repeat protein
MSRFGNLEFESENGLPEKQRHLSSLKDEDHFLLEAQGAFERGKFELALRMFARVIEFNPKIAAAWTGQVRMLIELGEFEEARLWADKALALFPDEAELLAAKGVALGRLGDLDGAISYADAAVESQMNTPYIWLARGDVLLARREKRAEYCFERALDLAKNNWLVLWLAARIQAFYRHFARALKHTHEALALDPGRAVLWLQAGEAQLALGLAEQARNSFEQARELDPEISAHELIAKAGDTTFLDKVTGRWRQWFGK